MASSSSRAALQELGYAVIPARDATEAMRASETAPRIDLLFTDVVLPGGTNGRMLAEHLTARRPGLPVLFATGYTNNAIVHQGRLDPGVNLLTKPYTRDDLARKIRQILDGRPPGAD